ncbi:MAG: hypothetical protein L3J66_02390 [Bacteroidales bacterium]|nr:hypothetical protein [Bacteroidales bacterium]
MRNIQFSLIVFILVFSSGLFAQDYIYLRDQQKRIAAKNIRISGSEIRYESYDKTGGQVYSLPSGQVSLVAYQNGEVRLIERKSKIISRYDFKRNLFTYHLFDLVVNNFTVSYERILKSGKIGIEIPLSFGYSENNSGYDDLSNKFYSGLYLNFYPTGQGKVRYFMGPGIRIGVGHNDYGYYDGNNYIENNSDSFYGKLLVNNGIIYSPISTLSLSAILSLGIRYFPEANYSNEVVKTVAAFSFNLAYRF